MNRLILENKYLISIIMPVYNTEQYFKRCIESVLQQSYKNLEIIIVDDCSEGNIKELAQYYIDMDKRVSIVSHEVNKGLFQARLTGAEKARGQYIAFIDSDDYVSLDYYHTLLDRIVNENCDIVIGHTVHQNPDGYKYIYNLHDACFNFIKLEGDEIKDSYFGQKGLCYSWHTIWNKLYSKDLWDKCEPYYHNMSGHVIMTEDIAFSSVLFYFAKSVTTTANDAYFYCANENASTNASNITFKKFEKNLKDIRRVFDFVEGFLLDVCASDKVKSYFHEFRRYYARLWANVPKYQLMGIEAAKGKQILKDFCPDESESVTKDDQFFASICTQWCGGLEDIKERIILSNDEFISFDVFDTLINRPFYDPTDLFELLDKEFENAVSSSIKFKKIRIDAEAIVRKQYGKKHPQWQDINIQEIYEGIGKLYDFSDKTTEMLMNKELDLELEFCGLRNAGKELYETALLTGKKVIIISDMYLSQKHIEKILQKNGYNNYDRIYISSEVRLTKNTGDLYHFVRQDLQLSEKTHIFHIGDTWNNDYINAEKNGFTPIFFPKAKEVFENKIKDVCTNECSSIAYKSCGNIVDICKMKKSIGLGVMYAIVYNKYFDNPYRPFNMVSDFNADPYFIGFYTLGMHLVGIVSWIKDYCCHNHIHKLHFLARDGYMPMKAYNILTNNNKELPDSNYMYASRKSVLPGMIQSLSDFYDLPIEYKNHSPKTLLKILDFAIKNISYDEIEKICENKSISYNKIFKTKEEYLDFIRLFLQELYDEERFIESYKMAKEYYSSVGENDITFDMGYSGRIQKAISNLADKGVDVLFVHSDNELSAKMKRLGKFSILDYYDFIPHVSGLLREHILSDYCGGCIGFRRTEKGVEPILEQGRKIFQDLFVLQTMQKGALDFVNSFNTMFNDYFDYVPFHKLEVSLPFEGYLRNAKDIDKKIFSASYFEDFIYGAVDNINVEKFTEQYYDNSKDKVETIQYIEDFFQNSIKQKRKLTRAIIYFLLDKTTFSKKMADELRGKPFLYKVGKWFWNLRKKG